MHAQSRFTVVTPNYNMGEFLEETIISILSNISDRDEYYIIDGGSTDKSIEIIHKYSNRISGWISERDHGYADAIAKGFSMGAGRYLCWINSGDLLLKGALNQVEKLFHSTDLDMIFGDDLYIDLSSRVIGFSRGYCCNLRKSMIFGGWTPLQDACFWKRSIYESIGGIDPSLENAADFDLFARLAISGKTLYTPFTFSAFRAHEGQRSIKNRESYKAEREKSRKELMPLCEATWLSRLVNQIFYSALTRIRARVLHKYWDLSKLHNLDARKLKCKNYYDEA